MPLCAYVDESGQLSHSRRSSDHFVLAALVCRDSNLVALDRLLARIKDALGRRETDQLTWKKIKKRRHRVTASEMIGSANFVRIIAVVVCKRHLEPRITDQDAAYLKTFEYLLQRMSWLAERHSTRCHYTLSHVKNFEVAKLPAYEAALRARGTGTEIKWDSLDPIGGRISNDTHTPRLQLADLVASATAKAFEEGLPLVGGGPADQTFLMNLAPRYMRGRNPHNSNVLTSYGLKMHPWKDRPEVQAHYPWLLPLR
ncbi:MAG: DUF3800 domain-containing protein [Actinomycetota bacterium]|nr:DUF3800 domain-containing protein [Actinomycetota bacterium]